MATELLLNNGETKANAKTLGELRDLLQSLPDSLPIVCGMGASIDIEVAMDMESLNATDALFVYDGDSITSEAIDMDRL